MEPVAGQKLGRYTLTRRLGAGGMAEVWEATDELLKRRVAVKIVRGALAESPEFSSRFLREARLAAQLQHSGIVAVFDVGLDREALFVVMPVLSGGSLSERLARPVDDAAAIGWLTTLASALDYAHGKGVVHRDVKPLNVLFDEAGSPHLSDFGLAKGLDEATHLTQTGMILGTPLYMSPEQAMGTPAGPAADQYSLGIVAYRLLAGRLPFEKEPTPVLLRRTAFEEMPPPTSIRPGLAAGVDVVFSRVLAKAAGSRFPSCTAFAEALARALSAHGASRTSPLDGEATKPEPARPQLAPHSTPPGGPRAERRTPPPVPPPSPQPASFPSHLLASHLSSPPPATVPTGARRVPAGLLLLLGFFTVLLGVSLWIVLRPGGVPSTVDPADAAPTPSVGAGAVRSAASPIPGMSAPYAPTPIAALAVPSPSPTEKPAPLGTPFSLAVPTERVPATPRAAPTRTPTATPTPRPSPTPTPWPSPTPSPRPSPTATLRPPSTPTPPPAPSATRPSAAATRPAAAGDPLADVPRRRYPADMRVKDAWVEIERMGSHTLVFRFTESLEGRGESIGFFGTLSVPTRGDAPLLPGARIPLRLLCKGLDSSKAECHVPPPADAHALQALRLDEGDRVAVRAVLAGFSFSATLRVED
jgi:serine/threonine-protein kinase